MAYPYSKNQRMKQVGPEGDLDVGSVSRVRTNGALGSVSPHGKNGFADVDRNPKGQRYFAARQAASNKQKGTSKLQSAKYKGK